MLWSESEETNWSSFGCTGPGAGGLTWTSNTTATGWSNLAQLLKAGIAGAQAGNRPGHKLLIAIHTDVGGNNGKAQAFYSNLEAQGVPFDVIALSYYPIFQGSLAGLRSNVDELATRFHKPIVIAETEYSWTLANGDTLGNATWEPALPARPTTTRPCSTSRDRRCRRSACTAIPFRSACTRTLIQLPASSAPDRTRSSLPHRPSRRGPSAASRWPPPWPPRPADHRRIPLTAAAAAAPAHA
jgi:hypothetical protein